MNTDTSLFAFMVFACAGLVVALVRVGRDLAAADRRASHYEMMQAQLKAKMRELTDEHAEQRHRAGLLAGQQAEAHRRTVEGYEHILTQMRRHVVAGVPHASRLIEWRN